MFTVISEKLIIQEDYNLTNDSRMIYKLFKSCFSFKLNPRTCIHETCIHDDENARKLQGFCAGSNHLTTYKFSMAYSKINSSSGIEPENLSIVFSLKLIESFREPDNSY